MKKTFLIPFLLVALSFSCVSKKKYVELQNDLFRSEANLAQTRSEKEAIEAEKKILEDRMGRVQARVDEFNAKISTLKTENESLYSLEGKTPISNITRQKLNATLTKVDQEELANAKTMEDSVNLAISYNLKKSISDGSLEQDEDISISVDKTVVMINVSDRLLFNTGSYQVSRNAENLLKRLAEIINEEPAVEVMIEGHTDPRSIQTGVLQDNWDLSVKRATSIVRLLQNKYNVDPQKLIAAGRSSYIPVVDNNSQENMAKNRRTRIVIIPDLDKFFAMIE
jgi:chemotaxis protein MotB